MEIFETRREAGMFLSGVACSSLVDACAKRGEIRNAQETFEKIKPADVVPNVMTFNQDRGGMAG